MQSVFAKDSNSIQRALTDDNAVVVNYGFSYPYKNNYDLVRGRNDVSYKVDIMYDQKGKIKVEKMKVRLAMTRLPNQDRDSFFDEQDQVLDALCNILAGVTE